MQDHPSFDELLSDACYKITTRIPLNSGTYTIMDIESGYHSYMFKIREKCEKNKVGT